MARYKGSYEHRTESAFAAQGRAGPKGSFRAQHPTPAAGPKLRATNVNFFYGTFQALHDISLDMLSTR